MTVDFMKALSLALVLLAGSWKLAIAQQDPASTGLSPVPSSLSEILTAAMKFNPEIVLAETRVRQAEAELNQVRMKVTQAVMEISTEIDQCQQRILLATERLERISTLKEQGAISDAELLNAQSQLLEARMSKDTVQARLRYLSGAGFQLDRQKRFVDVLVEQPDGPGSDEIVELNEVATSQPEIVSTQKKLREIQLAIQFERAKFSDVMDFFRQKTGVNFVLSNDVAELSELSLSIRLNGKVSALAALDAVSDVYGVVPEPRSYGYFISLRRTRTTSPK